ncbi:probable maltase [Melanopsichium pennsylvanicum]|uniref:Probable maltase n=2 Tax=Melanopsichium pennsylvanicum TaxID=63383 RepID=A0AAJ4XN41_9BASI|nr:probable maltase [Melanopsichium pennsylvanicum 4]SNX85369.1 probable maltase [Melanopsichium pennsylvanicum]
MPSNESLVDSSSRTFWFRDAIVYQIWPASFRDCNNDGMGDIQGIISSLDYIKSLGVNTIWLSPMYDSPQVDMGYDISDYESVYPPYGTVADMDELIKQCHTRGLKLILDLVINHTSDQHAWFKESRKSKHSPKRDWYIWRPAKYDDHGNRKPPNNWRSNFNQPAWTWDEQSQEYYLHLFCPEQPDLNWTNDECRKTIFKSAMEFWLDKGVNGFRVDTVNMYSKPMDFPDAPIVDPGAESQPAGMLYCNGPMMHTYLKEMGAILEKYDAMTVGELPNTPKTADVVRYVSAAENELSQVFQFDIVDLGRNSIDLMVLDGFKLPQMKRIVDKWQRFTEGNDAWTTVFIENHDQARSISRFASDKPEHQADSGKLLALMNMSLTGTVYVYQGEEIGMTNVPSTWGPEEYLDVNSINYFAAVKKRTNGDEAAMRKALEGVNKLGRDNARTPVQWSSAPNGGFSKDPNTKPWMRTNDNYKIINVEAQESDPKSVLNFYRKVIAVRKQRASLLGRGLFRVIDEDDEQLFKFIKVSESGEKAFVVLNFTDKQQKYELPSELGDKAEAVLDTREDGQKGTLKAYEGRLYVSAA